jgi:hypothetical protein
MLKHNLHDAKHFFHARSNFNGEFDFSKLMSNIKCAYFINIYFINAYMQK